MSKSESKTLNVIARAPFEVYYEGEALSLSAINRVGEFDILPGHADFFSVLSPCEVLIETAGEPIQFTINNGILTVRDDNAMLFVNI